MNEIMIHSLGKGLESIHRLQSSMIQFASKAQSSRHFKVKHLDDTECIETFLETLYIIESMQSIMDRKKLCMPRLPRISDANEGVMHQRDRLLVIRSKLQELQKNFGNTDLSNLKYQQLIVDAMKLIQQKLRAQECLQDIKLKEPIVIPRNQPQKVKTDQSHANLFGPQYPQSQLPRPWINQNKISHMRLNDESKQKKKTKKATK
ncbi:hypothetical protein BHU72_09815 [Desulfuribacillus stibiiarsenatis]|uniref:Uncharacterized protein n=1 Tax=Desulfuribacillus stibiiarsenatis TaxID=1390249 RepID=A0A1E5L354_9FIRM|nr:hypothetical protein [Desulfuribacillus stibiiarsenatis]OEH84493.1 hypothetical protein BHU72_09815 [Desulfuribacillus stibiiarsenatis]